MKQRFSSLDVKVIAHELQAALVSLRLSNVYDLSSKILLLKFAKPENKKQLVIDSGFRCHLTEFARTTAAAPSAFVARLRKFLKTRRVTGVAQIGTDRIIEFQFSDGQYRLYLEFFASGNIILTDHDMNIVTLMRNVFESDGQEAQRVGLTYSLSNRQNYGGVPPLTKDRLRVSLKATVEKMATAEAAGDAGKKVKRKSKDELRRGLVTTMTEFPPLLVDHAFHVAKFDSSAKPGEVLQNDILFEALFKSLEEAKRIVDEVTGSSVSPGYIIAKEREDAKEHPENAPKPANRSAALLYEDFHPFLPHQYADNQAYKILEFDNFNKTVDTFFSSVEGQKLESRLTEREATAKRKLEATRQDHAKRIEGLQEAQQLNFRKAAAIVANVERVQEAMDAVNGLLQQGMDWVDIGKLVEREQKQHNPVAEVIKLPLKLAENTITLLIGEEEELDVDEDEAYETDSTASDDVETWKQKAPERRLEVDINLGLTPWSNSREYFDQKRTAAAKEQKTVQQSSMALRNAEQKIALDLKKGLKQEKAVLHPIRRQMWFEKFAWFISSDGYLVLGGRDIQQNEILYKRYLRKGDVYVHADLHGAPSVIVKNNPKTPDAPIPPSTLSQAGDLAVCSSNAWDSKAGMGAYWVEADQVSKSAPTGEFLPTGSFMVRGKKNFLSPSQLTLGFGVMFKISEESKGKHFKHRLHDPPDDSAIGDLEPQQGTLETPKDVPQSVNGPESADIDSGDELDGADDAASRRQNPLQLGVTDGLGVNDEPVSETELSPTDEIANHQVIDDGSASARAPGNAERAPAKAEGGQEDEEEEQDPAESTSAPDVLTPPTSRSQADASTAAKKGPAKRGQRSKAKKIATKYKDQDEDDRVAAEALIGAAAGRLKAEAEARAKAEKEAELAAQKERRRVQHQRQQQATKEHEEIRRLMLDEGVEVLDDAELASSTPLDVIVGTPLPGDEILEAIPVAAPYAALGKLKYKAKMQPGPVKKGKAVKEILERWMGDAGRKGSLDEHSRDSERMWPREVELIKGLKPEECINCVPVGKVKVMMGGGGGAPSGGRAASSKGGQGKGGKGGGRGQKKK